MKKIEAIIRPERLNDVKQALDDIGIHGMNFIQVTGRGAQRGIVHQGRSGEAVTVDLLPKVKLEVVVGDIAVERAIDSGVMVVVAAGNEGPDLNTIASPGTAPRPARPATCARS